MKTYIASVSFKSNGFDHCYHKTFATLPEAKNWCVDDYRRRTKNQIAGLNFIAGFENGDTLVAGAHNVSYCVEEINPAAASA